ncbi:hypothetical protein [Streptomyces sp. RP5T]|uniref:hypothetical protein n=1 Tax=Streptomyces sp. RP5T TaxID=2490848 RepID=UPI000F653188|nr:hypothetical protein [Streptomyces sp. RP5T]RRR84711.1 hypothetical protein EHS43_10665 [Streptomyces sp. RP5T]
MSTNSAFRKRLAVGLLAVLCLAAGTVVGDRFIPFRGTGAAADCGGILSAVDMGFIEQTGFTGRHVTSTKFTESGAGDAYRLDCMIDGDDTTQLDARVRVVTTDAEAWENDLKERGRLPGETKPLSTTAAGGQKAAALSGDSSAALYVPCRLDGDATAHLSVSVEAPGASDGNTDSQRLTIAAIASRLANHSVLEAGCAKPVSTTDQTPSFAS